MVAKMLRRTADAAINVAGRFTKKVEERRLMPILQRGQELYVLATSSDKDTRFILPAKRRAVSALVDLLRGDKEAPGPLPMFNRTTNIVDLVPQGKPKRASSYVDNHVEYDVVSFHLCTVLGQPRQSQQISALKEQGYLLLPLVTHPHCRDIRQALNLD